MFLGGEMLSPFLMYYIHFYDISQNLSFRSFLKTSSRHRWHGTCIRTEPSQYGLLGSVHEAL